MFGRNKILLGMILLTILCTMPPTGQTLTASPFHGDLKPYINFLQRPFAYPTDYVMELFENHDLVILCERFPGEASQYEIITELLNTPGFAETVGHIFTELGTTSSRKRIDAFLADKTLAGAAAEKELLAIFRDLTWFPVCQQTSFYDFLRQIKAQNQELSAEHQIHVYPSDIAFSWEGMTYDRYQEFKKSLGQRDKIIAAEIEREFRRIQAEEPRKKALVLLSGQRAWNDAVEYRGKKLENTGRFLFESFPGKVANVLINTAVIPTGNGNSPQAPVRLIQEGLWDAAFWYMGNIECGFDLDRTPFGKDQFDLSPEFSQQYTYRDVFTGMFFYQPLVLHRQRIGIPELFDANFKRVFASRMAITGSKISAAEVETIAKKADTICDFPYENMADLDAVIKQWLKAGTTAD